MWNTLGTNDKKLCGMGGGSNFIRYNEGSSEFGVIGKPTSKTGDGEAIVDTNMFSNDGYDSRINIEAIVVGQEAFHLQES